MREYDSYDQACVVIYDQGREIEALKNGIDEAVSNAISDTRKESAARVAELEAENARLTEQLSRYQDWIADHDGMKRLEAEVARLTPVYEAALALRDACRVASFPSSIAQGHARVLAVQAVCRAADVAAGVR